MSGGRPLDAARPPCGQGGGVNCHGQNGGRVVVGQSTGLAFCSVLARSARSCTASSRSRGRLRASPQETVTCLPSPSWAFTAQHAALSGSRSFSHQWYRAVSAEEPQRGGS